MKREAMFLTAAIAATIAITPPPAQAQATMESVHSRALAAAAQGPDALRQFVQRTRMIYGLDYNTYANREGAQQDADITFEFGASGAGQGEGDEQASQGASPGEPPLDELQRAWRDSMLHE